MSVMKLVISQNHLMKINIMILLLSTSTSSNEVATFYFRLKYFSGALLLLLRRVVL